MPGLLQTLSLYPVNLGPMICPQGQRAPEQEITARHCDVPDLDHVPGLQPFDTQFLSGTEG